MRTPIYLFIVKIKIMQTYKKSLRNLKLVAEPLAGFHTAKINASQHAAEYLRPLHPSIDIFESFTMLLLNRANNITAWVHISSGGLTGTVVDVRIILKYAIEELATGIILCHNHPSGNTKPSSQDIELTKKLKQAANIMDIVILDHIILAPDSYYSFADEGIL